MVEEQYVTFETAKLLKEKGFNNDDCHTSYDSDGEFFWYGDYSNSRHSVIDAPTQQMAMRWLREVYNIIIEPESVWDGKKWEYQLFIVTLQNVDSPYYEHNLYKSYEECVEAAIKYCLEHLI